MKNFEYKSFRNSFFRKKNLHGGVARPIDDRAKQRRRLEFDLKSQRRG